MDIRICLLLAAEAGLALVLLWRTGVLPKPAHVLCAALLLTAVSIAAAYIRSGQAGRIIAVTGFLAMLCACAGLYYGILGYREDGTYRLFPRLGCGLKFLLLAGFVSIYILGW